MTDLGFWIHTTAPQRHTHPGCGGRAELDVHEKAAQWRCCGFTHQLPPLHQGRDFGCRWCADKRSREEVAA